MAENNEKSLKTAITNMYESVKGPVFWFAIGYAASWYMARNNRKRLSV